MTAELYLDGVPRHYFATFTATASRPVDTVSVLNLNRQGLMRVTGSGSVFAPDEPTRVSVYFQVSAFGGLNAGIMKLRNLVDVEILESSRRLRARFPAETDPASPQAVRWFTLSDTEIVAGTAYQLTLEWDGAGALEMSIRRNSVFETVSVDVTTDWTTSSPSSFETHYASAWPRSLDGAVWGAEIWRSGTLAHYWPITDEPGPLVADLVGGRPLNFVSQGGGVFANAFWFNRAWARAFSGQEYRIPLKLTEFTRSRESVGVTNRSLTGEFRRTVHRTDINYQCQTVPLGGLDARWMRCFLDSVLDGAEFAVESPIESGSAVIQTNSYTEQRAARRGDGGANDLIAFGWNHLARL